MFSRLLVGLFVCLLTRLLKRLWLRTFLNVCLFVCRDQKKKEKFRWKDICKCCKSDEEEEVLIRKDAAKEADENNTPGYT